MYSVCCVKLAVVTEGVVPVVDVNDVAGVIVVAADVLVTPADVTEVADAVVVVGVEVAEIPVDQFSEVTEVVVAEVVVEGKLV